MGKPYDPSADPRLGGGDAPKPPTTAAQAAAEIDRQVADAKKKGKKAIERQVSSGEQKIASDLAAQNDSNINPLSILSIIPAAVGAVFTPDDYLVGKVGSGETPKQLGSMSLFDQLTSEDQLSVADPLKALFSDEQTQRDYIAGTANGWDNAGMKILETVGLVGDIVVDPLNLVGGIGIADDAFKAGAKLTKSVEHLAERAAVKGPTSLPAKAMRVLEDYHTVLDDIDAQLAAGAIDDIGAKSMKADAFEVMQKAYDPLMGQDLIANSSDLAKARFLPGSVVREGGFGAKSRAALMTERGSILSKAVASAVGEQPMVVGSTMRLPIFGGRTAAEMTSDAWAKGYGALTEEARQSMGITGRIHRATLEDFKSGRAFNPFSSKAAGVMEYGGAIPTPMSFIRTHSIKGGETLVEKGAGLLRPTLGRSGKLWKAALELTDGGDKAVERGMARLRKEIGPDAVTGAQKAAAKAVGDIDAGEAVFANYPLTILNAARLDGLIRSGGKRLAKAAAVSQQEITQSLLGDGEKVAAGTADDPLQWVLFGTDDVVKPGWNRIDQAAFDSVDGVITKSKGQGPGGQLKVDLAEALRDSMQRLRIPLNLDEIDATSITDATRKVFARVISDPEFSARFGEIAAKNAVRMGEKKVTKSDLLRATMNALSTVMTVSKETHGLFDWIEAMTKTGSAKELFSSAGAEALGKEAKLMSYMEDMGLAVLYRAEAGELSDAEIAQIINDNADALTGTMGKMTDTFDRVLKAKEELTRGLKLRGLTEDQIAKIEDDIAQNVMDRDGMGRALADATEQARVVKGDLAVTDEELRLQKSALRDVERAALRLEETHLALLDYRSLQAALAAKVEGLQTAARAVDLVAVETQPLLDRISQLTTTKFLDSDFPEGGSVWKGVPRPEESRPAFLLNQGLGETDKFRSTAAGIQQQTYNRSLSIARDLFGDNVALEKLAEAAAYTTEMSAHRTGMTEGALNAATIARDLFEKNADPRITAIADAAGGWESILRGNSPETIVEIKRVASNLAAQRSNQIDRLLVRQAAGEAVVIPPALTRYGVTHRAVGEFLLGNFTDRLAAITPLVDDLVEGLSNGSVEKVEALMSGTEAMEILRTMQDGDFSYLNSLVTELSRGLDIAIGSSGGFGSYDTFQMLREMVMNDPAKLAVFERAQAVFSGIQNASALAHASAEAAEAHAFMTDEINAILDVMPNGPLLANRRDDLVEKLLEGGDLPAMGEAVRVSQEQRDEMAQVLRDASAKVRQTRSKLETMGRQSEKWQIVLNEKLKDLDIIERYIGDYQRLIDDGIDQASAYSTTLQQQTAILDGTPLIAHILGGSADIRVVKNGFIDFAQDPAVSFKTLADGTVKRRTDDEILRLWKRRVDGAAKWMEVLRDRAVHGYTTKAGKKIEPVTRYAYAKGLEEEWMLAQAELGFKGVWHHAALADEGGAQALIAIATNYPKHKGNEVTAALDMVIGMLKSGYVGTPAFSNRNLMGATMENIRQGVDPRLSSKVFGADSTARGLDGIMSFINTVDDEALAAEYRQTVKDAQAALEKHFGDDVFGAVVEAREIGVTDSVFQFQDISGISAGSEGTINFRQMLRSWHSAMKDTAKVARLEAEAKYGDGGVLPTLAAGTGYFGAFSTHPARWYEQTMAAKIESLSRLKIWEKVFEGDPKMVAKISELERAAEPFTARPGVEALVRVDLYAQRRIAGDSAETAFGRMMASHFDYTDLSGFDESMKRLMPFWIWRSRSLTHYAEMAAGKPSVLGHTFRLWEDQHRSKDPRAPRYTTEAGGGFDAGLGLGLAVPDPASDLISLVDQSGAGFEDRGLLGLVTGPAGRTLANDTNAVMSSTFALTSGFTPEGIPIDTPASIQGPLDVIAGQPGGTLFVEQFAHRKKNGKWYWNSPDSAYFLGETLPVLNQIVKITQPATDGDGILEKTMGAMARFFGAPVRVVPEAEQERNRQATMTRQRIAAEEQRRNG